MSWRDEMRAITVGDLPFTDGATTCLAATSVGEAIKLMQEANIGSIVIVDKNSIPLGIFTERDLLKHCLDTEGMFAQPIELYMTPNPKTVKLTTPMHLCLGMMRIGNFRHMIIVEEDGVISGMLSLKDATDFLTDFITSHE